MSGRINWSRTLTGKIPLIGSVNYETDLTAPNLGWKIKDRTSSTCVPQQRFIPSQPLVVVRVGLGLDLGSGLGLMWVRVETGPPV